MDFDYDVIVVGAGFAGVTAARECAVKGLRTLILEGRERIGGRTMEGAFDDGTPVDLGGTYVHWTQPYVWAEIVRYGLLDQVKRGAPAPDWSVTREGSESVWVDASPFQEAAASAANKLLAASTEVFPNPAIPLFNRAAVEAVDGISMAERIAQVDLTPEERIYAEGFLVGMTGQPAETSSYAGALRWFAMGMDNYADFDDMIFGWKLKCSTGGLLRRILEDGGAEIQLGSVVSAVESTGAGVTVTSNGQQITAASVVIATPSSAWLNIELTPALPAPQAELIEEGMQIPSLAKAMIRLRGETRSFTFMGDETIPLTMFTDKFETPDVQIVTAYPFPMGDQPINEEDVTKWVVTALPGTEVLDVRVGMHFTSDPMSGGGNAFPHLGHLTKYEPHTFTKLDDRVFFAGSDIAEYFNSFIDGAIESGLRAGRDVHTLLENH